MYEYKVVGVRIPIIKSRENGAIKLQEEINKQAKDGWRVHEINVTDYTLFFITFEKAL